MTTQESVQRAYQWAIQISGDKRAAVMHLFAAKQVQQAVEANERYDEAHKALVELLRGWTKERRAGLARPVEIISRLMGLGEDALVESVK